MNTSNVPKGNVSAARTGDFLMKDIVRKRRGSLVKVRMREKEKQYKYAAL